MALPSPPPPYDFISLLKKLEPQSEYEITPCTGGLINQTVRARCVKDGHKGDISKPADLVAHSDHSSCLFGVESFIIKFAPSYIVGGDLVFPLSEDRQTVEAAALSLFQASSKPGLSNNGPLHTLTKGDKISIPALYYFSETEHILIMEDLGQLSSIEDWLQKNNTTIELMDQVARRVGSFMAKMHTSNNSIFSAAEETFRLRVGRDLVKTAIVDTIPKYLQYLDVTGFDVNRIHEIVAKAHMREDKAVVPEVFNLGDFWPPSVILNKDATTLGIIDWELAEFGTPLQDIAQISAHLHLLYLGSTGNTQQLVQTLLRSMHEAYRETSTSANAPWLTEEYLHESVRQAWILHGREMINNAAERDWPECVPLEKEGHMLCSVRREMARLGAWYVDVAGRNVDEMRGRWKEVLDERILSPLYFPAGLPGVVS